MEGKVMSIENYESATSKLVLIKSLFYSNFTWSKNSSMKPITVLDFELEDVPAKLETVECATLKDLQVLEHSCPVSDIFFVLAFLFLDKEIATICINIPVINILVLA